MLEDIRMIMKNFIKTLISGEMGENLFKCSNIKFNFKT